MWTLDESNYIMRSAMGNKKYLSEHAYKKIKPELKDWDKVLKSFNIEIFKNAWWFNGNLQSLILAHQSKIEACDKIINNQLVEMGDEHAKSRKRFQENLIKT